MTKKKSGGKLAEWLRSKPVSKPPAKPLPPGGKLFEILGKKAPAKKVAKKSPAKKAPAKKAPAKKVAKAPAPTPPPVKITRAQKRFFKVAGQQAQEEKPRESFAAAFRDFVPKESEFGSVVFLSREGKRVPRSYRNKVYAAYVTRRGTVKPYKEPGERVPVAHKIRTLKIPHFKPQSARRAAAQRIFATTSSRVRPLQIRPGKSGIIDLERDILPKLTKTLVEFTMTQARGFYGLMAWAATTRLADGRFRTFTGRVKWDLSDAQVAAIRNGQLNRQWFLPIVRGNLYADIAEALKQAGMVSGGSSRYISQLAANEDLDREDWVDNKGNRWEKNDLDEVEISNLTIEPLEVKFGLKE